MSLEARKLDGVTEEATRRAWSWRPAARCPVSTQSWMRWPYARGSGGTAVSHAGSFIRSSSTRLTAGQWIRLVLLPHFGKFCMVFSGCSNALEIIVSD
jgi:hypothetical protein